MATIRTVPPGVGETMRLPGRQPRLSDHRVRQMPFCGPGLLAW